MQNAAILDLVQKRSQAKILLALKGFAAWSVFPLLSRAYAGPLWGVCASSVDEARLGREKFAGEVHAFAPAWNDAEIKELLTLADHIVFNSFAQWHRFKTQIFAANAGSRAQNPIRCGLRINPEHSEEATAIYNPCMPQSRLGIRAHQMENGFMPVSNAISGLHFHTLCEQGADALARTLDAVEKKFAKYLPACDWINFGGGHHITRPSYDLDLLCARVSAWNSRYKAQIYLEPGEAVALNSGWLVSTVLDIVQADMPVAILDISAACHIPDVLEMPYRPEVFYRAPGDASPRLARTAGQYAWSCRLAGKSCLAGDVIGEYSFNRPLATGQRLLFADMAIYSMVKTNTFNGLRLPAIGICHASEGNAPCFQLIRSFGYDDFKNRLS